MAASKGTSRREVMAFWAEVMRNQEAKISERLRASELCMEELERQEAQREKRKAQKDGQQAEASTGWFKEEWTEEP